jgi:predicted Rossmann-fold nucleotide-binding protein
MKITNKKGKPRRSKRHAKPVSTSSQYASSIAKQHRNAHKKLAKFAAGVAFMGSARTKPGSLYYDKNIEAARAVAALGLNIYHGGGPGNMEASAFGARQGGSKSLALCLRLARDEAVFGPHDAAVWFDDFSPRVDTLRLRGLVAMVFFPGGIGTMHEAMSMIDNIMQQKAPVRPIIFFEPVAGRPYWGGLFDWFKREAMDIGLLRQSDIPFVHIVESVDEMVSLIKAQMSQNKV